MERRPAPPMRAFLARYWRWIVIPVLLVLGALSVLLVMPGGADATAPFRYELF